MRSTGSRQRVDPPPTRAARCACKAGGGGVGCLWSSSAYLLLTPLSPAAAGSEQAMGPAFPVHEAAVRAEGIVRVMGTPGLTPASPRGSQGILSAVHAASLAAALNCGCPPRPSVDPSLCL